MTFSILFSPSESATTAAGATRPAFFDDLYLDRMVASIVGEHDPDELTALFYTMLQTVDGIEYRHESLRDLQVGDLIKSVDEFAHQMTRMRQYVVLARQMPSGYSMKGWFLHAAGIYCDAITNLENDLVSIELTSRAFVEFRQYLVNYAASATFTQLCVDGSRVKKHLSTVRYSINLDRDRIHVSDYGDEADYSADVVAVFEKFSRGGHPDPRIAVQPSLDTNHVEAAILDSVAKLNPAVFGELDRFYSANESFLDETIARFDREVRFYFAYLRYVRTLTSTGLHFCYPTIHDDVKGVSAVDTFDIVLADQLRRDSRPVITNDFDLTGPERILVVTGPNQGGKTTFARTFGQLHYLGRLGLLVPGTRADLYLFDHLFTHFERHEDPLSHHGKLEGDLLRIRETFDQATDRSIVLLNEIFTSTTLEDAIVLGTRVLERLIRLDAIVVCVTFLDELSSLDESTVSLVATVDPADPGIRTLHVVRQPADGLAYAQAIADRYGVSYSQLKRRLTP